MSNATLSLRVNRGNPNHHLWNNHGTWWLHYTLHLPDFTTRRIRKNLGTHDLDQARERRDELFATLEAEWNDIKSEDLNEELIVVPSRSKAAIHRAIRGRPTSEECYFIFIRIRYFSLCNLSL